jgi:hypothetical protein
MFHSDSIAAIACALAEAQAEIENVTKDGNNPAFRSKYATLAAVLDVCRPVMAKHGIAIVQTPGNDGESVTLTTTLAHKSGEWMRTTVGVVPGKRDAQGIGSAVTYLRRYSLAAMCGVAQEDDDGNAASAHANGPASREPARSQPATAPARSNAPQAKDGVATAKGDVRRWIAAMDVEREEAELLSMLDVLTPDDFRPEYKRIKAAFDDFTNNGK